MPTQIHGDNLMAKRLFVTPILNTMGPVTDPRHSDLLDSWDIVDLNTKKYFEDKFRKSLIDSHGNEVVISWFPVSWSGFSTNPVNRDFGWFTIYDHMLLKWREDLKKSKDGIFWMYNHPDKEGVGNAWGLDWSHNCHYLNILNRMIIDKNFFPGAIEIPTADTNSVNFVENFFPFELSNRNSPSINWDNIEADGKKTREVLQWADAPSNWIPYTPDLSNHQIKGNAKHFIFRLLDIKTRIMSFPEEEIRSAFESCREGHDVIIAGYEHDFRDRCDVVREMFLEPINRISKEYSDVEIINTDFQTAAIECTQPNSQNTRPKFSIEFKKDYLFIYADCKLFNQSPYVAIKNLDTDEYFNLNPLQSGHLSWGIQSAALPLNFIIGIGAFADQGRQNIGRFKVSEKLIITEIHENSNNIPLT